MTGPGRSERERAASQIEEAAAARRGFFFITGAKVWFLVCGIVLNIGLPRILGDAARFGDFGVVNTLISIINMVIVAGGLQAVSKRVSEAPEYAAGVLSAALRIQTYLGAGIFVLLFAGADLIAVELFHDPALAGLLRVASFVSLFYAWYAPLIGTLNGLKRFRDQAAFDVVFATLKTGLIIGLVLAGFGVFGAFVGFASAAAVIALLAFVWLRRRVSPLEGRPRQVALFTFMLQVMGYVFASNVLLQGDVLLVKSLCFEPIVNQLAEGTGQLRMALLEGAVGVGPELSTVVATEATAILSGLYRATKNVSLIPYQAVIAVTFVIFPLISRATFEADRSATKTYLRQTFRVALILVAALATSIAAGGEDLVVFLFGEAYRVAFVAMFPLLGAMTCFALLFVMCTVLTAGGYPRDALGVSLLTVIIQVVALLVSMEMVSPGAAQLELAAWVSLASIALGLVLACAMGSRRFRVPLPGLSVLRVCAAVALSQVSTLLWPGAGLIPLVARAGITVIVFGAFLWLTREITLKDIRFARGRQ